MEINKSDFFNIFSENFNFPIVDTKLGKAVKMDSYNAFLYTVITGAGYFDNPVFPYTPKGLLKVFYNAFDYKFVTGLFENTTIKNTPFYINNAKPFVFNGYKYIIPIEFDKEVKLIQILEEYYNLLEKDNIPSTNFIIQRIETRKKGNGMEPFMEYLTSELFKKLGYVVETQIPLAHNIGSPDFGGYKIKEFMKFLNNNQLSSNGIHLIELSLIRIFDNFHNRNMTNNPINNTIVGEVKTSSKNMTKQLEKYLNTSLFDIGYEIHPSKKAPDKNYFGLISLSDNYKLSLYQPESLYTQFSTPLNKEKYLYWLENYIKFYLIANLTNDEFEYFYESKTQEKIGSPDDIINFINNCGYDELFNLIINL